MSAQKHRIRKPNAQLSALAAGRGKPAAPAASARRGPGRPPRLEHLERQTVLLPPELRRAVKRCALEEGKEISAVIAEALRSYGQLRRFLDAGADR